MSTKKTADETESRTPERQFHANCADLPKRVRKRLTVHTQAFPKLAAWSTDLVPFQFSVQR